MITPKRHYAYTGGYKYRLEDPVVIRIPFNTNHLMRGIDWTNGYLTIKDGRLHITAGYAWNGPSGPLPDTPKLMFPSLIHDAYYQCLREGAVPMTTRVYADKWFGDLCVEQGIWGWVSDIFVTALTEFGDDALREGKQLKTMKV